MKSQRSQRNASAQNNPGKVSIDFRNFSVSSVVKGFDITILCVIKEVRVMKRALVIILAGMLLIALAGTGWATESSEEKELHKEATEIDRSGKGDGAGVVSGKIEKEFSVSSSQVKTLRDRKMGFGEITIALSLARTMPGGVTDDNIQKVMAMRQGPPVMGWGAIAKQIGTKLGPVVSNARSVSKESREALKGWERGETEKAEKGEKAEKAEKAETHQERGKGREAAGGGAGASRGKGR